MDIFIDNEKPIEIKMFFSMGKDKKLIIGSSEEEVKKNKEYSKEDGVIQTESVFFRQPTYKDNVKIYSNSVQHNMGLDDENSESPLGKISMNLSLIQYTKLVTLLDSWTFKDKDGVDVPLNKDMIDKLHPQIASYIIQEIDSIIE